MSLLDSDPSNSETKFICEHCFTRCDTSELLTEHIKIHKDVPNEIYFYCDLCNMSFMNKGLLACHMSRKHNTTNIAKTISTPILKQRPKKTQTCFGCMKKFNYHCQLEYHIRKAHFNLISKSPYCTLQDINKKWYEKVTNTNIYVELKKVKANTLFIRKVNNMSVKPLDMPRDLIDVRMIYPLKSSMKRFPCIVCSKFFFGKDLSDHVMEKHKSLAKEMCSNCNCWYKPVTKELKHVCPT